MNENTELEVVEIEDIDACEESEKKYRTIMNARHLKIKDATLVCDKIDDLRGARSAKKAAKEREKQARNAETEDVDE